MFKIGLIARVSMSAVALLGGLLIMFISITAANPVKSAGDNESEKKFYFGQTILPDHLMYPLLMIADRVKLETVTGEEEVYTRVAYSVRRFEAAKLLLQKDKEAMAYSTLTKSQKYLHHAGNLVNSQDLSLEARQYIELALTLHSQSLEEIKQSFGNEYSSNIDQMILENKAMLAHL